MVRVEILTSGTLLTCLPGDCQVLPCQAKLKRSGQFYFTCHCVSEAFFGTRFKRTGGETPGYLTYIGGSQYEWLTPRFFTVDLRIRQR